MNRLLVSWTFAAAWCCSLHAGVNYRCEPGVYATPPPPVFGELSPPGSGSPFSISVQCPSGTVAILAADSVASDFPDEFARTSAAQCSAPVGVASAFYCYAGAGEIFTGIGAAASFEIHEPVVAPGDYHSLAELAVSCCLTASPQSQQIVEAGWIVDPPQFGDSGNSSFRECLG